MWEFDRKDAQGWQAWDRGLQSPLRLGVNILVYALAREGSPAQRLVAQE